MSIVRPVGFSVFFFSFFGGELGLNVNLVVVFSVYTNIYKTNCTQNN